MQDLKFEFDVDRDLDFVFEHLYQKDIYRIWSQAFSEGSHYVGELKEGSDVTFLNIDDNGIRGTVSKYIKNELIDFHLTHEIKDGKEVEVEGPGNETYYFSAKSPGVTHIKVELSVPEDYVKMMVEMWEKAIERIKTTLVSL